MPGRLRRSFRSGNLAEHLGLLLLKGIAAVAEVSRPEDVGLDAIATLLRHDEDGNSYAEDSFVVQLKSASATSIEYAGHELDWFVGQTQPMFIGLVSLADAEISLYPTLHVNQAVLALGVRKVTVKFGPSELPPFFPGKKWGAWGGDTEDSATVWLGPPLLTWRLSDLADDIWHSRTYEAMKKFLALARREIELLSLGQCSTLDWLTNDAASITSQRGFMKGHPDDLVAIAERCAPALKAIMLGAMALPDEEGARLMIPLIALAAALRNVDVDIDPDNLFSKTFLFLRKPPDAVS
jgi:hypothetical protein